MGGVRPRWAVVAAGALLLALVGLGQVGWAWDDAFPRREQKAGEARAQGEIVDIAETVIHGDPPNTVEIVTVRFRVERERLIEASTYCGRPHGAGVGDEVTVLYVPDRPDDPCIEGGIDQSDLSGWEVLRFTAVILVFLAGGLAVVGLLAVAVVASRRS